MKKSLIYLSLTLSLFGCKKEYITNVYPKSQNSGYQSKTIYPKLNQGWSSTQGGNSVNYKIKDNVVYFSGMTTCSYDAKSVAFVLDSGFCPKYEKYIVAATTSNDYVVLTIFPSGQIYIGGPLPYAKCIVFDGVQFLLN